MPKKSPCIAAIKKAVGEGEISDAAAEKILSDIDRAARTRKAMSQITKAEAMRDIAGELEARNASRFAEQRRNLLMHERHVRDHTADMITSKAGAGRSIQNKLLGSESKAAADAGEAGGTFINIASKAGLWPSRLGVALRALGDEAADFFYNSTKPLDFLKEWEALTTEGGQIGRSGNKLAAQVAKVVHDLNGGINPEMAAHGARIVERERFMGSQTWSTERLHALGRESHWQFWKRADQDLAYKRFQEVESPLWDWEVMTEGGKTDPWELMRDIFNSFWEGKHRYGPDVTPSTGGGLANRFARERVVIYKDAESYHAHEVAHGRFGGNYAMGVIKMFENKGRTLALLQDWGPKGKEAIKDTIALAQQKLHDMPDGTPGKAEGLAQMNRKNFVQDTEAMYDMVAGLTEIPDNMVIALVGQAARTAALTTTGGAMLVNSLGDLPISLNQMTYAGADMMDAFATRIQWLYRNSKVSAEALHQLGIGSALYMTETQRGFRDLVWGDKFRSISQGFHTAIGMTRLTENTRAAAAIQITSDFGRDAHLSFEQLNPDMQRIAAAHGITSAEWNVIRKAVHTIKGGPLDGYKVLSHEKFYELPDEDIAAMVSADGNNPTNAGNMRRKRAQLERKYGGMINERVAAAASEPGGWENWIKTGGTHAGSWGGEARRSLFMYKSFLMSVTRRQAGQAGNVGRARFAGRGAVTLAGLTVAGYMSAALSNILKGKEPPKWLNEDGSFSADTLKKSWDKSGGLGLYGSVLMGDYDKFGRGLPDALAGPVFGKAADAVGLLKSFVPSDDGPAAPWAARERIVERNIPFANIYYIKPVLDHAIFWNIREMLQPGSLHRMERNAEGRGEGYYIRASEIAPLPLEERIVELGRMPKKAVESIAR